MQTHVCTCHLIPRHICAPCAESLDAIEYYDEDIAAAAIEAAGLLDPCPMTLRSGQLAGVTPRSRDEAYWDRAR